MSFAPPRLSIPGWITIALAAGLVVAFCLHMWSDWLHNPDLSHGLFAPFLFLILLRESRQRGPWRHLRDTPALRLLRGLALGAGLLLVGIAGLYAAAIDWTHALVSLSLALALSALLFALLLWLAGERVRAMPLNWAGLVAIALWPLCAPIPPGTYSRITLQLQFWVTDIVLASLHLLGIAASTSGNIILLAHTTVGVEEACSGVRSLLSCTVVALFFSATLVRRPWTRALLVALALPLAFGMNILRSLGLTLLANAGTDIEGAWHDVTGFAVLGVTAALLGGIALWLEDRAAPGQPPAQPPEAAGRRPWGTLAATLMAAVLVVFFALNTHGPSRPAGPAPDLATMLPPSPPGWDLVTTEDLYRFSSVLATDHLVERTYVRHQRDTQTNQPLQITVYLAYWPPGQVPVSLVASHTPDACWPAGGWQLRPREPVSGTLFAGGRALPAPEYRAFTQAGFTQNVWYWHLYDGRSITQTDPRSAVALLKLAWRHGFHTAGEQLFIRISSNRPWSEIQDNPLLLEIVNNLRPHGL